MMWLFWLSMGFIIGITFMEGLHKCKTTAKKKIDKVIATIEIDKETNETRVLKSENK